MQAVKNFNLFMMTSYTLVTGLVADKTGTIAEKDKF